MGYRWRRTYYLTGLPGWMRFGYSPGWIGRSPSGLPPMAEWIISSGLLPQFQRYLASRGVPPMAPLTPPSIPSTREQEIQMLRDQAKAIEAQLEATRKRLEELKKSSIEEYGQPYYPHTLYTPYTPSPYPFYTQPTPEEELSSLEDYKKHLEDEIKGVEGRIEELKRLLEEGKKEE